MRRTSLAAATCPVARSLDVIGDWWSLLIVRDALRGLRRFGEFQKSLGLAKNILASRLRSLTAEGILEMTAAADGSAYHDYVLTPKGRRLMPVLLALRQWGMESFPDGGPWGSGVFERTSGEPVAPLQMRSVDGRLLGAADVEFRSLEPDPA